MKKLTAKILEDHFSFSLGYHNTRIRLWVKHSENYDPVCFEAIDGSGEGQSIPAEITIKREDELKVFDLGMLSQPELVEDCIVELSKCPCRLKASQIKGNIDDFNTFFVNEDRRLNFSESVLSLLCEKLPKTVLFPFIPERTSFMDWMCAFKAYDFLKYMVSVAFDGQFTEEERDWMLAYNSECYKGGKDVDRGQYYNLMHEIIWDRVEDAIKEEDDRSVEILTTTGKSNVLLRDSFRLFESGLKYKKFKYVRDWFEDGNKMVGEFCNSVARLFQRDSSLLDDILTEKNKDIAVKLIKRDVLFNPILKRFKFSGFHLARIADYIPHLGFILAKERFYFIEVIFFAFYHDSHKLVYYIAQGNDFDVYETAACAKTVSVSSENGWGMTSNSQVERREKLKRQKCGRK